MALKRPVSSELSKRIFSSLAALVAIATALAWCYHPLVQWVVALLVATLAGVAMWEYCHLRIQAKKQQSIQMSVLLASLTPLTFFISTRLPYKGAPLPFLLLSIGAFTLFLYHFNKIEGAICSIAQSFFGICYIAVPLGLLLHILYSDAPLLTAGAGRMWLIYLLVVTKMTDIGGYFGGTLLGKRKLAPQLSPGKTYMGAIMGLSCALFSSLLFHFFSPILAPFSLSLIASLLLGALIGLLSLLGDLAESLLKRDANKKDSNSLPGLGGMLDTLDSLLFTTPALYFFTAYA